MYNSCERRKATKHYNCTLKEKAKRVYQFIYTDLVGPITLIGFDTEKYFFTFTNDYTCITKIYIGNQKSE